MRIDIYTDGSCKVHETKNGTGAFIVIEIDSITDNEKTLYQTYFRESNTTNNRMELLSVINALQWCEENTTSQDYINFHIDSTYVQKGLAQWAHKWRKNGWKRKISRNIWEPIPNADLWQQLWKLHLNNIYIKYNWVKGHSSNKWNNYVDKLCKQAY